MSFWQQKPSKAPKVKAEPLVIKPDYRVAAGFFLGACACICVCLCWPCLGTPLHPTHPSIDTPTHTQSAPA